MAKTFGKATLVLWLCVLSNLIPNKCLVGPTSLLIGSNEESYASEPAGKPDIEWFKKELKIDPKYVEHEEGILGLSWAHFLTMVFLILSFAVGLTALIVRQQRTKELLALLLAEEKKNEPNS